MCFCWQKCKSKFAYQRLKALVHSALSISDLITVSICGCQSKDLLYYWGGAIIGHRLPESNMGEGIDPGG